VRCSLLLAYALLLVYRPITLTTFLSPAGIRGIRVLKITEDGKIDEKDEAAVKEMVEGVGTLFNLLGLTAALLTTCSMPNMDRSIEPSNNTLTPVTDPEELHILQTIYCAAMTLATIFCEYCSPLQLCQNRRRTPPRGPCLLLAASSRSAQLLLCAEFAVDALDIWTIVVYQNILSLISVDHGDILYHMQNTISVKMAIGLLNGGIFFHMFAIMVGVVLCLGWPTFFKVVTCAALPVFVVGVAIIRLSLNVQKHITDKANKGGYGNNIQSKVKEL
jgi:hypothetical protein